ncbi:MAG: hypothetical protein LBP56_04830 [Odoribacteraceae bacterium]|jgi:FtsZ-binding cell division protein ZapB|nr:hypothetical protein [Odoribacteraceae bacterium]
MDEHVKSEEGQELLVKRLKTIVIVLTVVLITLLVFFLIARHENRMNMQVIHEEKEILQQELTELSHGYDGLKSNNDSLNAKLTFEQEKIAGLIGEMKTFRASSYAEINRYKKEVNTLKAIMRGYVVQIDSLGRINKKLLAENSTVKKQMDWVRERNKTLEEKTTRMEETLERAATLSVERFNLSPINTREKTTAIRKCAQLKAGFVITKNVTAKRGARDIYLRVTRPDGNVIIDEGIPAFKYQNVELACTARREIVYEGEQLEVSIYWPNDGSLVQGKYVADLFSEGQQIGTGEFILK